MIDAPLGLSSGARLDALLRHDRGVAGLRALVGLALAETLAAAIVDLAEWDRRSPVVDPFAGSGTIAIEAALVSGSMRSGR